MNDKQGVYVLLTILIFLIPVSATDTFLTGLFASFGSPWTIFLRRHLLGSGLKLVVVALLVLFHGRVNFLAFGYLAANVAGMLIYSSLLVRLMYRKGLFKYFQTGEVKLPTREMLSFTIPVMASDVLINLKISVATLLLGYFSTLEQVALFHVVLPLANLNQVLMHTFSFLYTPTAARLFAKGDHEGMGELYWRTTVWMAVFSFPIFAVTFFLASPVTVSIYGARYEQSATILAVLSLANYFSVTVGLSDRTLKVLGKVRWILAINLGAAVVAVVANLLLIPKFGALGAALATGGTLILHNLLRLGALGLVSGIFVFAKKKYVYLYITLALNAAALSAFRFFHPASIYVSMSLICLSCLFVVILNKKDLRMAETFPELVKLPLMRAIFT